MMKLRKMMTASLAVASLIALTACGEKEPEEVVREAKKAMSEVKGSEVETELKIKIEADGYEETEDATYEAKSTEKRSHDPLIMHRELTLYEDGEEVQPGEQYVDEEGEMYALVHDNWMVGSWNIKDDDPIFSLTGSYVNGDHVVTLFQEALDELKEDEVGYAYEDGMHVLTLDAVHKKFDIDPKNYEEELPFIAMGTVDRIEEYDVVAKINGKTSLLEEVTIQLDFETIENYDQPISATLKANLKSVDDVVIAIPEEVQNAKDGMADTILSLSKEAMASVEGLNIDTDFSIQTDIDGAKETSGMNMGFNSSGRATEERAPYSKAMQREVEVELAGESFAGDQYVTESGNVYMLDEESNEWLLLAQMGEGNEGQMANRDVVYLDEEFVLELLLQMADDVEYDDHGRSNYGLSLYNPHELSAEMGEAFQKVIDPGATVEASRLSVSVNSETFLPESVRISVDWSGREEGLDYVAQMSASSYISALPEAVKVDIPQELLEAEGADL